MTVAVVTSYIAAVLIIFFFGLWIGKLRRSDSGHFLIITYAWKHFVQIRRILEEQGLPPRFRLHTAGAMRFLFDRGLLLNLPMKDMKRLADPVVFGMDFVSSDPKAEAGLRAHWLRNDGYTANVVHDPDPDIPTGALSVVTTNAIPGCLIVYRKRAGKMGVQPKLLFS